MGAGGNLDVKALLERLQPAQRHAETGIALAGRDGLEQLVGRTGIVDELDVKIMLLEEAVVDGDRHRGETDSARVPGQLELARGAGERRRIRRGPAQRKLREIDAGRDGPRRKGLCRTESTQRRGESRS